MTPDVASKATEELEDGNVLEQSMLRCLASVAKKFPHRRLNEEFMESSNKPDGTYTRVRACDLRYEHLDARVKLLFQQGTVDGLAAKLRAGRNIDASIADNLWHEVKTSQAILDHLHSFNPANERALKYWLLSLHSHVSLKVSGKIRPPSSHDMFAVSGALAYSDPTVAEDARAPWSNPRAGYVARSDLTFRCKRDPIATVKLSMTEESTETPWQEQGSNLPEILCLLAGKLTCVIGLLVSALGYFAVYRDLQSKADSEGNPVFKYFNFPDHGLFDDCRGTAGSAGRMRLLRIIFEITLCSTKKANLIPHAHEDRGRESSTLALGGRALVEMEDFAN
jgi:hypothetical protein